MPPEAQTLEQATGEATAETQDAEAVEGVATPDEATLDSPETDADTSAETEVEGEAEPEAEPAPSIEEILARENLDDSTFDELVEKYPGLAKKLRWKQDQVRDAERQRAQSEAAKRTKAQYAQSYASGQVSQQLAALVGSALENGQDLTAQDIQRGIGEASRAVWEFFQQNSYGAVATALNEASPKDVEPDAKLMTELGKVGDRLYTGEATFEDWMKARIDVLVDQAVKAREPELRKRWEKEVAEKSAAKKQTQRLKDADSERRSSAGPTTTTGAPIGDDPDSVLANANPRDAAYKNAFKAKWGFDLRDIAPGA